MGCHFLLQGIFLTQESNPGLLHYRQILYQLSYEGGYLILLRGDLKKKKKASQQLSNNYWVGIIR